MAYNRYDNQKPEDDLVSELSDAFESVADALREVSSDVASILSRNASDGAQRFRSAVSSAAPDRQAGRTPERVRTALSGTKELISGALRVFLNVCGGALALFAAVLAAFAVDMFAVQSMGSGILGVVFLVLSVFGAAMCFSAARRSRLRDQYLRYVGTRRSVSIRELADAQRKTESKVRSELQDIIRHGGFREAYLAPDGTKVFFSADAYRAHMKAAQEAQTEKEKPAAPPAQPRFEEEPLLHQLAAERRRVDDIPVRSEVEKLEHTAAEIFDWVRRHPSDASQVRRVTSYYLPTTIKLLRTYNEMDLHAESSAVAEDIQHKIHTSLVSVNEAMNNLRDTLLRDTALDVDAEISALSTVLAQEGLVSDEISRRES